MKKNTIIIGTRGSDLALWQAHFFKKQIEQRFAHLTVNLKIIQTKGDNFQNLSFEKLEGKGFFTKEIEDALLQNQIDIAIHSYKDLPTQQPEGLIIAANSYRENPSDWLLIKPQSIDNKQIFSLKQNATVATSSARRKSQLLAHRPDLTLQDIRGNVPTRIQKLLQNPNLDAIMLAAAGIQRLNINLQNLVIQPLKPYEVVPAPAQGVLAYQIRQADLNLQELLQQLHHKNVAQCIDIERNILKTMGGGCQQPIGVFCEYNEPNYCVWASYAQDFNHFPKKFYIAHPDPQYIENKAVILLKQSEPTPQNVFISREIDPQSYFYKNAQNQNQKLNAFSFVQLQSLDFELPKNEKNEPLPPNYLFFNSSNGIQYFFEKINPTHPILKNSIFAVIGSSTAHTLQKYGITPAFVGNSTHPKTVGVEFNNFLIQNHPTQIANLKPTIWFLHAQSTAQSIQKQIDTTNFEVINIPIYQNLINHQLALEQAQHYHILIFTSPLNAQAFCQKHTIQPHQKVIAIGTATAQKLIELNACPNTQIILPYLPNTTCLADVCF